ncbi:MAG: hypothetical protein K0Q49_2248 [Haloplasmataceae bacterium]|jgi:diguanylate cyclase (GGDEF)-like protein/PAS domain S-box-containing protein|nr:hypothetical protein [Haloplasmataceae bacterium]
MFCEEMAQVGRRKSNLVKKITSFLCILFILLAASILSFHFLTKANNISHNKTAQYMNINLLLNELESMINDLDKYSLLYELTNDETFYQMYQEIVDVYEGKLERDSGIKISYQELINKEINVFNPNLIEEINVILKNVDLYINYHKTSILQTNDIVKLSSVLKEYDTGSDYYDLNLKIFSLIKNFKYEFNIEYTHNLDIINNKIRLFYISLYFIVILTAIYLLYILLRLYLLFIKPIMEGYKFVEELSKGKTDRKWIYKYNNQFKDLVDSFNNYVELSKRSYSLISDQYYKLKVYSDVGEVNYFEYDFDKSEITAFYSGKFVNKYNLDCSERVYKVKEYLKLIHKDDLSSVDETFKSVLYKSLNEFKIEFRIKFPNCDNYCFSSCTGQRKIMGTEVFIGVQIDITDLKITQKRLIEQEEQYRIIIENSTDLIGKFDPLGNILYASKSYTDIFKHNHIIGVNASEFHNKLKVANFNWVDKVVRPPYSTQEVILVDTDQGDKWISFKNDALLNNNNEVVSIISVGHDITELQKMNDKLKYDSEHDLLTGLLNRRGLFNKLAELELTTIACFFIDINNFKNINDFYGHEIGDIIIEKVANELIIFRERNCIISRLSGDEFVLIAPNYNTNFNLSILKTQLNKNLQKNYYINNNNIYITSSVGYALYPDDTTDINKLITYADIAMYEAKIAQQRNSLRFTKEMFETINKKVEIANDLKKAIDIDEFEMLFQDIIDTNTNKVCFVESLVRWNHPIKGVIGPNDFLPVAEESGLMEALDMLIINKSLKNYCELKQLADFEHTKISINVSPIMLLKKDFPSRLIGLVIKLGIFVSDICIEIRENTFINNIDECSVQITKLRNLGFLVAIDDFGREFSSLSILDRVEFDIIKIDRLFVSILHHETNVEIVKMITKIAKLKNKLVIVEGVETKNQVDKLTELGCTILQGFYFSIPHKINETVKN